MKTVAKVLAGLIFLAGMGVARADFEGQVDMKMTTSNSSDVHNMTYYVKGQKMRVNMEMKEGRTGGSIFDWKNKKLITIMDKQKMYMEMTLHPEKFKGSTKDHHFSMHKTGRSETIAGYSCDEYAYSSDDTEGSIWFTAGLGNWWANQMASQSDKLNAGQKAMLTAVLSKKLFPMKWEGKKKGGEAMGTTEVTRVEKKSLPSSMFEAPAGYKKMQMPSFDNVGGGGGKQPSKEDIMNQMKNLKF